MELDNNRDVSNKYNGTFSLKLSEDHDIDSSKYEDGYCKSNVYHLNDTKEINNTAIIDNIKKQNIPYKELKYGWFNWNPSWLQWINNAIGFTVIMTIANVFQSGTVNGLVGSVQSSMETRFQLTSTQSSMIILTYEIATIPLSIFVAYKGTVGCHRPRWTSSFLLISAIGCFVYAIPHFTTPVYLPSSNSDRDAGGLCYSFNETDICNLSEETSSISEGGVTLQAYLAIFIVGRVCLGFGSTALYNFAVTYIDDCLTRDKFGLYSSMLALAGVIGPALGYIVGGVLLETYTDFTTVDTDTDIEFDQNDPRWVGAWWVGYLAAGVGGFLSLLPMTGYPHDLPGASQVREKKTNEASGTTDDPTITSITIDFKLKDIKKFGKDLFTNWSWLFLTLYICCDRDVVIVVWLSLVLEHLDRNIYGSAIVVPAGCFGAISGGLIIERLKLSYLSIVKMEFFITIGVCFMGTLFLVTCSEINFAGINLPYGNVNASSDIKLVDTCNNDCICENKFDPICSHDNVQYLSPCYAGCMDRIVTENETLYENCACIPLSNTSISMDHSTQATGGVCDSPECNDKLIIFGVMLFFAMAGIMLCEAVNLSTIIRVVPNSHRLFSLMCTTIIVRLLGTIPGPVLSGYIFNTSCLLWQQECDGSRGNCFHYDNNKLGYLYLITQTVLKVASCIFMFLACKLYKAPVSMKPGVENEACAEVHVGGDMINSINECDKKITIGNSDLSENKLFDDDPICDEILSTSL